jgi:hypothetical protein
MIAGFLRAFGRAKRGSVSTITALSLPLLIGVAGLVAEYGHGLLVKVENQRVADLAAYAGALAYNSSNSTTSMTSAADAVGSLNGLSSTALSVSLVSSPSGDGNQAVEVTVATQVPLMLSHILEASTSLPVSSTAYAELKAGAPACIIALKSSGAGVTLSGGTAVTAAACAVASDNTVSVPCGDTITTPTVDYDSGSAPSEPCSGIQPPSGVSSVSLAHMSTPDPLAGNTEVTGATSRLSSVTAMTAPGAPSVSGGTAVSFAYSTASTQSQLAADGCSGTFSGSTWTVTCSGASSYTFGNITTGGGITVNFNVSGSASTTYNFNGSIDNTGTAMTFGPGTYNISQGLITGGGTTTTFGAGTYNIGEATSSCNGAGDYSICNTGTTLTFGGPSTFVLTAGVYNSGGSKLTLGSGSTNSFQIGASSTGNAVYVGGGSTTVFADATGSGDVFQLDGNFNVASGGGSCMTISAASEHDINGNFATAGGTILGSGIYTVTGYVGLGANGGGDVTCNGSTVGMSGTGVTFVIGGASTPSSGSCSGQSFCLAAGYNHVTLSAPSTGSTADLVVVGPTSTLNTTGATFTEGASNTTLSGAFYYPNGALSLSGGASVGGGTGQCLELIGSQVTLSGGTTAASNCISGGSSGATVRLVQ